MRPCHCVCQSGIDATFFQTLDTIGGRCPHDQWQPRTVQRHVAETSRNRPKVDRSGEIIFRYR